MKNSHLVMLMEEAKLSPEQMAKKIDVSSMTIRRWAKQSDSSELPKIYSRAIEDAVTEMIGEGLLKPTSKAVTGILSSRHFSSAQAVIKSLGIPNNFYEAKDRTDTERLMMGLSEIGADVVRSAEVKNNIQKIKKHKGLGEDWPEKIKILLKVISSKKMAEVDKFVAFGALFYLIDSFDFISDDVPVVGLLDDYAILSLAVAHYLKRFPGLNIEDEKVTN
jgi:uncharacterized membrane protein YkvA (DUF1232 family)